MDFLHEFWINTGFANFVWQQPIMLMIGALLVWLAIVKGFEPLLLVPIGFGVVVGQHALRQHRDDQRLRSGQHL